MVLTEMNFFRIKKLILSKRKSFPLDVDEEQNVSFCLSEVLLDR